MRALSILQPLLIAVIGCASLLSAAETVPEVLVPTAGEQINWRVQSGGGGISLSDSYIVAATIGQTAAGLVASSSYRVNQGF